MTIKVIEVPDFIRSVVILDPTDVWNQVTGMGLGQLAVRLGYPGGFDNRGDVIFTDSFEEGLTKGTLDTPGTGDVVELSSASNRLGAFSVKLTAPNEIALGARYLYYLPYPTLGKLGFQVAFTTDANTTLFEVHLLLYDGAALHAAGIRYNHVTSIIECRTAVETYTTLIENVVLHPDSKGYHYLKFVIDLADDTYHRVLVDGWSWVTGGVSLYTFGIGTSKRFYGYIRHRGLLNTNPVSYVDGVIFTQNEPPN